MFYFYDKKQDQWHVGNKVEFPDGEVLTKDKKTPNSPNQLPKKDYVWYDEPPQAYLDWLEQLNPTL